MNSKNQIVPLYALPYSLQQQLANNHRSGQIIYLIILFFLLISFILLFIIKTDINVRSTGTIKSLTERNDIKAPAQGVIDSIFIKENAFVKAGEPLLKIRTTALEERNGALGNQYNDIQSQIQDLNLLVVNKSKGLQSPMYIQQYNYYLQKLNDASNRYNLAIKNYERYNYLYKNNAVSALEVDKAVFDKRAAESEMSLIKQQQQSQWQTQLNELTKQKGELSAQLGINEEDKSQYMIRAATSGTVQDLKGLQPGSIVAANEILGNISPNEALIAEVYVLPKDIGLIKPGNPVKIYIDAFNYTSWGDIKGVTESISGDVFSSDNQPYFKVRCKLEKTQLQLKNGFTGQLKKGMTMQARFKIARRTLFQLLYDQTNDWLNPNSIKDEPIAIK